MPSPPLAYTEPESGTKGNKVRVGSPKTLAELDLTRLFQDLYRLNAAQIFVRRVSNNTQKHKKHGHPQNIALEKHFQNLHRSQKIIDSLKPFETHSINIFSNSFETRQTKHKIHGHQQKVAFLHLSRKIGKTHHLNNIFKTYFTHKKIISPESPSQKHKKIHNLQRHQHKIALLHFLRNIGKTLYFTQLSKTLKRIFSMSKIKTYSNFSIFLNK